MKAQSSRRGPFAAALLLTTTMMAPLPASAQSGDTAARIARLEKQLSAVQRQLFPGGDARFFEGDIQAPAPGAATPQPVPGGSAIGDLATRLDALERQLALLTGQQEQLSFRLREVERQLAARPADAPVTTPAPATGTPVVATPGGAMPAAAAPAPAPSRPAPATATSTATSSAAVSPTPVSASPQRIALVRAVPVPATGNEVEDAYSYGYRLWEAKLYPEAQAQLKKVVERFPRHSRASYAQNLLGRAYLDEGKPSLATVAFYNNYKDRPQGDRAPHSLMYMGVALERLGRKADACKAFVELDEVFGTAMPADVRRDSTAAKARAGC